MKWFINLLRKLFGRAPTAPMKWEKRLDRQMLFFSAPNYYWAKMSDSEIAEALDTMLEAGIDGPSVEFAGRATADEYNGNPDATPIEKTYRDHIKAWRSWEHALAQRGMVAHLVFMNTNSKRNNTISDTEWSKLANEFIAAHGTKNKIILPASETDARTRASIRTILDHTFRQRVPANQMIHYGPPLQVGFGEYHSQKGTDIPAGDKRKLVVSDSGPAIGYLYGGDWRNGGTPDLEHITAYVRTIKQHGCSGAVYSFGRKFDAPGCRMAGKAWK